MIAMIKRRCYADSTMLLIGYFVQVVLWIVSDETASVTVEIG